MAAQLKSEAMLGYTNSDHKSPFLSTSNSDSAWHIGQWLKQTHRSAPRDVRPSRGDTFHVNDMKVRITWAPGRTNIERIA